MGMKDGMALMVKKGFKRIFSRFYNDQSGITGLETAIVLIAFVVVAAVFAFTVLTTGLFTSEKAKETALAGVATTSSSLTVKGNIIAESDGGANVEIIRLKLATATGVERVEFIPENVIITYLDDNGVGQFVYPGEDPGVLNGTVNNGPALQARIDTCNNAGGVIAPADYPLTWCYKRVGADNLIDPGEVNELYLFLGALGTAPTGGAKLAANTQFTVEIIPQDGAVVKIDRRIPISVSPVMNLN